jgi:hypothetical protein
MHLYSLTELLVLQIGTEGSNSERQWKVLILQSVFKAKYLLHIAAPLTVSNCLLTFNYIIIIIIIIIDLITFLIIYLPENLGSVRVRKFILSPNVKGRVL